MDPEKDDRLSGTLRVRELRPTVAQPGFRVDELILVTTMLDPLAYNKDELARLYFERARLPA